MPCTSKYSTTASTSSARRRDVQRTLLPSATGPTPTGCHASRNCCPTDGTGLRRLEETLAAGALGGQLGDQMAEIPHLSCPLDRP
jgi:hypothetical protein